MFNWKVEDMALMAEWEHTCKRTHVFKCESELSRDDKLAFVDSMQSGELGYLLDIVSKYESANIPKDKKGCPKPSSLRAWLAKNDARMLIDRESSVGRVKFFSFYGWRYIYDLHSYKDIHDDIVDEFFHLQLLDCLRQEQTYFKEHDEYCVLTAKLFGRIQNLSIFGNLSMPGNEAIYVYDDSWDEKRPLTIEELKLLLSECDKECPTSILF